jgi:hypothetical protein
MLNVFFATGERVKGQSRISGVLRQELESFLCIRRQGSLAKFEWCTFKGGNSRILVAARMREGN